MTTKDEDETILVCPNCDTFLGSSIGAGTFSELVATYLATDLAEADEFANVLRQMAGGDEVDEEIIERLEDRMGPTEVEIN
jgi:hypothetical protein